MQKMVTTMFWFWKQLVKTVSRQSISLWKRWMQTFVFDFYWDNQWRHQILNHEWRIRNCKQKNMNGTLRKAIVCTILHFQRWPILKDFLSRRLPIKSLTILRLNMQQKEGMYLLFGSRENPFQMNKNKSWERKQSKTYITCFQTA